MNRGHREWLLVRGPGGSETRFEIGMTPLRIGRGGGNQLVLQDEYVSTAHAELVDRGGERCVRDVGSRNGTQVNGRPLAPGTLAPLRDGDVLQVGSCELTYRRDPSPDGAARRSPMPADEDPIHQSSATGVDHAVAPPVLAPPPPRPRREGWSRAKHGVWRLFLAGVAAVAIVAAALWLLAPSRVSLLVLGNDARPDELRRGERGRTDTVLMVVADRSPAGIALISLPRDLWVAIPGYGEERVNAAYRIGGAEAAKRAVGEVLGVRVDRYVLIGLQGLRDVVDAAGGVQIDVELPIHDDAYPTDDYGTIVVDIPAGRQHMDGETALRYARTRQQDNDFGRIARQQRVVVALRDALLQPMNWWRLPAVIGAARRATQTDLGPLDLVALATVMLGSPGQPDRLTVDLSLVDELAGTDGAYLLRPKPALRQRVAALLTPADAAVEILNGTGSDGLAKQAADRLRDRGMRIAQVGNAARPHRETTVEVQPGFRRAGVHAAAILDLPRDAVREFPGLPEGIDVRITLGDDRIQT
jgi:polyisoprenyl-teichoic acid--peptidoglycan teichoic acid transferase